MQAKPFYLFLGYTFSNFTCTFGGEGGSPHYISDHEEAKSRVEKNTPLSNIPKSVGKIFFSRQLALLQDGTNLRCVVLVFVRKIKITDCFRAQAQCTYAKVQLSQISILGSLVVRVVVL